MERRKQIEAIEKARCAAQIAWEGKAEDISVLDVSRISTVTDYYVFCTGLSQTHLRSLGRRIEDAMRELGVRPDHVDGLEASGWLVFDYGNVIVHAMLADVRRYYDIERLWGDAPRAEWAEAEVG